MASEIRVNSINNRSGLGTVTIADSGIVVSGLITATTFSGNVTGNVTGNLTGDVNAGVITATTFYGDGSALTGVGGTEIVTGNTSVQTVDTGSDGHIKINTEGVERVRINSSGNVGISTSNITYKFEISHASNTNKWAFNPGNLSNTNSLYSLTNNGATPAIARFEASTTGFHFYPGNSEIARIDSNGIKFNGDTAAANALDDYEEGSWTPSITDGYTRTYGNQQGRYIKIGSLVYVFGQIRGTGRSGTAGSYAYIALPYGANGMGQIQQPLTVMQTYNITHTSLITGAAQWDSPTELRIYETSATGNSNYVSPSNIPASFELGFFYVYYTTS